MVHLGDATLSQLGPELDAPSYDRSGLEAGIVHIGVGHFHRAHQAMYVDGLLRTGKASQWAICGVGLSGASRRTRDVLASQDYLYTLTEKPRSGELRSRIIGALHDYLSGADGIDAIVERIADSRVRIVSLTVTEGGYGLDRLRHADSWDRSWQVVVLRGLRRRREARAGALTVMSCDNIPLNGRAAREALVGAAWRHDPEMVSWVEDEVAFPSSMVDRVTPKTVAADGVYLEQKYGYVDDAPVTCEPYSQWVLEDAFAAGRPPLEDVGVELVADVEPYESMKLRLANGTHQALCYFGALLGHTFVHEAVADEDIAAMLVRYIVEEVVPTLEPIAGVDLVGWGLNVIERFGNPRIEDRIARICEDASDRMPKFLLPVLVDQLGRSGPVGVCAAVIASWARYSEGTDELGRPIAVRDPRREHLAAAARVQGARPTAFIEDTTVFGDLARQRAFSDAYVRSLALIESRGARALLRSLAGSR